MNQRLFNFVVSQHRLGYFMVYVDLAIPLRLVFHKEQCTRYEELIIAILTSETSLQKPFLTTPPRGIQGVWFTDTLNCSRMPAHSNDIKLNIKQVYSLYLINCRFIRPHHMHQKLTTEL